MRIAVLIVWGLLFGGAAVAQVNQVNLARTACKGVAAQVYAEIPASVGTVQGMSGAGASMLVPVCLALGPGLEVDTSQNPMVLNIKVQQAPAPWLAIERIDLGAAAIPGGQPTLTYTTTRTPVDGSAMIAILQGRPFGLVDVAPASGRQVVITLPAGPRPFVAGQDVVTLVYLTADFRPAPVARQ